MVEVLFCFAGKSHSEDGHTTGHSPSAGKVVTQEVQGAHRRRLMWSGGVRKSPRGKDFQAES